VTLERLRTLRVAVAREALDLWVAVVVLLALVAPSSAESGLALALTGVHVTGLGGGAHGVAVTGLATFAAGNFPVVFDTPERGKKYMIRLDCLEISFKRQIVPW